MQDPQGGGGGFWWRS